MLLTIFLALTVYQSCVVGSVTEDFSIFRKYTSKDGVGSRLILTPYIEENMLQKAKSLSAVNDGPFRDGIPSYSGYFTVNKRFNSNLFFWFFPADYDYESAPVILWLQGGPGASSLYGLFAELGPFSVSEDNTTLVENPYSWHKNHSLIFIDNPVGTGFSFTDFNAGLATNQTQIGEELYCALIQFFTLFSELKSLPFFIAGESYAGKYVPSLGYTIHNKNPTAHLKINLQGIAVGNGWTDPVNMMGLSSFLYQLGLVDDNVRETMQELEEETVRLIEQGNYEEANVAYVKLFNQFDSSTELPTMYNFLHVVDFQVEDRYTSFLRRMDVRRALHVGDVTFKQQEFVVYGKLELDILKTVKPWLEVLLENYRVLYYNGQLDIMVAYIRSSKMFSKLEFSAAEEYKNATRVPWYVDGEIAGYIKSAGKFTEVLIRNAGHSVPIDQPVWALELITNFTRNCILNEPSQWTYVKTPMRIPWYSNL